MVPRERGDLSAVQSMTPIAHQVWDTKYRWRTNGGAESSIANTWGRVAAALSRPEATRTRALWTERFRNVLGDGGFLPGGRIIANAGTGRAATLFSCFVMGAIDDSIPGILRALREGMLTMHRGGGIGIDFSTLHPAGTPTKRSGGVASGPVSIMEMWDTACRTLLRGNPRHGAMMGTLRCDHPDIVSFIEAKRCSGRLSHFNLSVQVTDAFIKAVRANESWTLRFPSPGQKVARSIVPVEREIKARQLWHCIARAAHECAEPGVLFIDRINAENNLSWMEQISATNPCAELPLPAYGACNLGSLDLTKFVRAPFQRHAQIDFKALHNVARCAVRMLDNVVDLSSFPLRSQAQQARATRRIGLGITGLADAWVMLGLRYGSDEACDRAETLMRAICHSAYAASIELARERGPFPRFQVEQYVSTPFIRRLPAQLRDGIAAFGIRNSHLTAVAPTGSISLLAGGISSAIEPIFAARFRRQVLDRKGNLQTLEIIDPAIALWQRCNGDGLPTHYLDAAHVPPLSQLKMQAAVQRHVDNGISKTITLAQDANPDQVSTLLQGAYDLGLKGCTVFRPGTVRGTILDCDNCNLNACH